MPPLSDQQAPDGGAGWYPDPLGAPYKERYFDGKLWTLKIRSVYAKDRSGGLWVRFTDEIGGWPTPVKITAGIGAAIFVVFVIGAIGGKGEDPATEPSTSKASVKAHEAFATPLERKEVALAVRHQQTLEFKESVADSIDHDDSPSIRCAGQTHCGVTYEIEELVGIDTDEELLNDQRDVWAALFANPKFRGGFIELEAPVVSLGGKESIDPVLIARCDRAAANQIDWENVMAEGFRQLCKLEPLIGSE